MTGTDRGFLEKNAVMLYNRGKNCTWKGPDDEGINDGVEGIQKGASQSPFGKYDPSYRSAKRVLELINSGVPITSAMIQEALDCEKI